jgi:class 3 adenylate cyclase
MAPQKLRVLLVDDSADDALLLLRALSSGGFEISHQRVETPQEMTAALEGSTWDIVISDYSMPRFSGMDALAIYKESQLEIPFLLVSGTVGEELAVQAMRGGAHDYILKQNLTRLVPAIRRELQEMELRKRHQETHLSLKRTEDRLDRLKRFFSPQIAELMASGEVDDPFRWHRKEVTVLFIDLHGFTNFVETSEPEEVLKILQEYYSAVGQIVQKHMGTVGHVAGDGIMASLNDPIDIPNHQKNGVLMALEARDLMRSLTERWRQLEYPLDFGAGIASGYATIGGVGADGCWDYSIFGTVTNTASRLCSQAKNGQILVSQRFLSTIDDSFEVSPVGEVALKGLHRPLSAFNVLGRKE